MLISFVEANMIPLQPVLFRLAFSLQPSLCQSSHYLFNSSYPTVFKYSIECIVTINSCPVLVTLITL